MSKGPSDSWLRRAAEAEDACPSVSVGGLAADLGLPLGPRVASVEVGPNRVECHQCGRENLWIDGTESEFWCPVCAKVSEVIRWTPSPSTAAPARNSGVVPPLTRLSVGDLSDLIIAYVAGEVSEGFLRDITGLPGDVVRGLWFDAIERAKALAERFGSERDGRAASTSAPPASSSGNPSG